MEHQRYIIGPDEIPSPEPDLGRWSAFMAMSPRSKLRRMTQHERTVVVTRFTGVDRGGNNPPHLWETLVIGGNMDGLIKRHATGREANRFHDFVLLMAFSGFGTV